MEELPGLKRKLIMIIVAIALLSLICFMGGYKTAYVGAISESNKFIVEHCSPQMQEEFYGIGNFTIENHATET